MPLNTNIALGVQAPQFESPMKMALAANQLREAQMKAQEYEAVAEERNRLRALNPADPDYENQLMRVSPTQGIAYRKGQREAENAKATRQKTEVETFAAKRGILSSMMRDLSGRPDDENIKSHFRDVQESPLFSDQEKADLAVRTERLLAVPFAERGSYMASQGATVAELKPSVQQVNQGGQTQVVRVPAFGGNAATVGTYADVPLPDAVQAQNVQKANAGANRQTMQVNTMLPASEETQKQFMQESRQTYGTLKQAPTVLDNIEKAKALVPQAKGFMGAGGESVLQAASFLNNRLGTSIDTKGVTSAEELRSRLFLGIMDNLKKLDSQPSQQQQAALQIALGSIGTDPTALPRVLDVFGETIRQKVDLYNEEVQSAEGRGVKFPYNPVIKLQPRPAAGGAGAIPDAAIKVLQSGQGTAAQFNAIFGPGAAEKILGKGK
jgi:hypothetical protein